MTFDLALIAISGVVFVAACVMLAIRFPEPTPFQLFVFRTVLALSAAGAAAAIPGFLSVTMNLSGFAIRAGGALAVFLIVYRLNPATLLAADRVIREIDRMGDALRTLEVGVTVLASRTESSKDAEWRYRFANYLDHISSAIDSLVHTSDRKDAEEEWAFEQACGMISQHILDFQYHWSDELPRDRSEQIRIALQWANGFPGQLRHETRPEEVRRNSNALSKISGRFRAIAQATRVGKKETANSSAPNPGPAADR